MIQQLLDEITEKLNILEGLPKRLNSELSQIDKEEQDVIHIMRCGNFNACDGYKLSNRVYEIGLERTRIKNTRSELDRARLAIDKYKSLKQSLEKSKLGVKEAKLTNSKKVYSTRVIDSKDDIAKLRSVNKTDIRFRVNKQVDRMTELFGQIESNK